ncbi:hypothetical protein V9T40_012196 [Parthenolecanium corni]|uniref:Uncharacterized protein n=1 Tax=Parthenolecanium corni TaxID=536013 RepID=A0AAN9Y079_9HEMI
MSNCTQVNDHWRAVIDRLTTSNSLYSTDDSEAELHFGVIETANSVSGDGSSQFAFFPSVIITSSFVINCSMRS